MKKELILTVLVMLVLISSAFAHRIAVGQTYAYEWKIVNVSTGQEIASGKGSVVPVTSKGFRNMETYVRDKELDNWDVKSWTRNVGGVKQRLTVTMLDGEEDKNENKDN